MKKFKISEVPDRVVKIKGKELVPLLQYMVDINRLKHAVNNLIDLFYVKNYFTTCECCDTYELETILKSEAKSFKKIKINCSPYIINNSPFETYYATEESYAAHLPIIKKWESEVKEYLDSLKKKKDK